MLMMKVKLKSPSFSCVIFPENYQFFLWQGQDSFVIRYDNPKYHAKFMGKLEAKCWANNWVTSQNTHIEVPE